MSKWVLCEWLTCDSRDDCRDGFPCTLDVPLCSSFEIPTHFQLYYPFSYPTVSHLHIESGSLPPHPTPYHPYPILKGLLSSDWTLSFLLILNWSRYFLVLPTEIYFLSSMYPWFNSSSFLDPLYISEHDFFIRPQSNTSLNRWSDSLNLYELFKIWRWVTLVSIRRFFRSNHLQLKYSENTILSVKRSRIISETL